MKPLLLIPLFAALAGCSSPKAVLTPAEIPLLTSVSAQAEDIVVYEGLPHQNAERELYQREIKRADVRWIEGSPFYARPIRLSREARARLTKVANRGEEYAGLRLFPGQVPATGADQLVVLSKFCGGFHADFAVVWTKGDATAESLICFGCHEWQNFTAHGRIYSDLTPAGYDELKTVLSNYGTQRPKSKTS